MAADIADHDGQRVATPIPAEAECANCIPRKESARAHSGCATNDWNKRPKPDQYMEPDGEGNATRGSYCYLAVAGQPVPALTAVRLEVP